MDIENQQYSNSTPYFSSQGVRRAQTVICKATNAYFSHILTSTSLTAEGIQEFLPQRLLITYFAASAVSVTSQFVKPGSEPFSSTLKENLVADLVSCFDAASGGFCPMPCISSTAPPSIAMTFCALHVLDTAGALDEFMMMMTPSRRRHQHTCTQSEQNRLPVVDHDESSVSSLIKRFILRCYVPGRGYSSVIHKPLCTTSGGCQDAEVTPREACSALFGFWLVSDARREAKAKNGGDGGGGLLSSKKSYMTITASFIHEFNEGAATLGFDADDVVKSLLGAYVPHEGAFGACLGSSLGGGEGHSGLTFCVVVALTLLGFWTRPSQPVVSLTTTGSKISCPPSPATVLRNLIRYAYARRDHFGLDYCDDEEAEDYGDGEEEEWLVGFQGRPNKDSDTCYSFWLLSTIGIVERVSPWCSTMDEDDNDNGMVGADAKSIANDKKNITSSFIEWNGGCVSIEHQVNPPTNTTTTPYISFSDSLSKFTFQTAGVEVSSDKKDCTLLRTQEEMVGLLAKCPHVDHDPVHAFLGLAGVLVHHNDEGKKEEGGRYALCEAFLKDIWGSS